MLDPTRDELLKFLESKYSECGGEELHTDAEAEADDHDGCGCRFEIECAAYWLATHYHGGQWSNLYSALSVSEYRPGAAESDLPDDLDADDCERVVDSMLYNAGSTWIEGRQA